MYSLSTSGWQIYAILVKKMDKLSRYLLRSVISKFWLLIYSKWHDRLSYWPHFENKNVLTANWLSFNSTRLVSFCSKFVQFKSWYNIPAMPSLVCCSSSCTLACGPQDTTKSMFCIREKWLIFFHYREEMRWIFQSIFQSGHFFLTSGS